MPICFNKGNYYWENIVAAIAVMSCSLRADFMLVKKY